MRLVLLEKEIYHKQIETNFDGRTKNEKYIYLLQADEVQNTENLVFFYVKVVDILRNTLKVKDIFHFSLNKSYQIQLDEFSSPYINL